MEVFNHASGERVIPEIRGKGDVAWHGEMFASSSPILQSWFLH